MIFSRNFFRVAALCSFISVPTTLCLIFLPHLFPKAATIEAQIARDAHPVYVIYLWGSFVHPFFTLVAALGASICLARNSAGAAIAGVLFFSIWGFSEMLQQSLVLIARHQIWSEAYRRVGDPASHAAIANYLQGSAAVSDSLYALIVTAFLLANLLYAIASWRSEGLTRYVSWGYAAATFLSIFTVLTGFGLNLDSAVVSWLYPLIQPAARTLIGVWLWRTESIKL
jgi:hypothetical protein